MSQIPVVIGTGYNAYGIVRSLSECGIPSIAAGFNKSCFFRKSKYISQYIVLSNPNDDEIDFIADLIALGEYLSPRKGMLFPTHDEQLSIIAKCAEILSPYYELPFSSSDIIESILDKASFSSICEEAGVPTIKECIARSRTEALKSIEKLRFPLIVKINSWDSRGVRALGKKNSFCHSLTEFKSVIDRYYTQLPDGHLLIQEYIEDSERLMPNVNGVANRSSELECVFVSEKVRQHPPKTGTSTSTNAVDPEDSIYAEIVEYARRIVKATGFYGLFGIEFKYDTRDGVYKVIEMNPRSEYPNYLQTLVGQNMAYHIFLLHQGLECATPYYPLVKSAGCIELITDRFYSRRLYKMTNQEFALSRELYEESLIKPMTYYGLTVEDPLPFCLAGIQAAKRCAIILFRAYLGIPDEITTADFLRRCLNKKSQTGAVRL